ncbi:fatty acyl-AMP ligase [Saccharopolyspora hordei]
MLLAHPKSMTDVLRNRALSSPERVALRFLLDGELREQSLDYAELDHLARAAAAVIQQRCSAGDRVLLMYPPGVDFVVAFFACMYAGVISVPAYPPDPSRPTRTIPRLQEMASDAKPVAVLTSSAAIGLRGFLEEHAPELSALPWIVTDELPTGAEDCWVERSPHADDVAFLQYTSGSTGAPKGVVLSHGNLLHNSQAIRHAFHLSEDTVAVSWLPPYHDMGLIGGLLQPVFAGFPVVLLSPLHAIERPMRWLEAISRYRATVSGGPNFAFDLCVRKSTAHERAGLDLSEWRLAFVGADTVRPETLRRFAEAFAPAGFTSASLYPCYGLAEATLLVAGAIRRREPLIRRFDRTALIDGIASDPADTEESVERVSTGQACLGTVVEIRDPDTGRPCPDGRVGEICVHGPGVAQGYWERPVLSADVFPTDGQGRRWLRTGDLGVTLDGELYFVGRAKDVVVLQGVSHHPQDLENTAERVGHLLRVGSGAAFSVGPDGDEDLVLVYEIVRGKEATAEDLEAESERVRTALLAEHGVRLSELVLIRSGSIPKTSSGKIQRQATKMLYEAEALDQVVPLT